LYAEKSEHAKEQGNSQKAGFSLPSSQSEVGVPTVINSEHALTPATVGWR
jgi:hypothetical protein